MDDIVKPYLTLSSASFLDGEHIPDKYTCDGENISPQLEVGSIPEGTESLALIVEDPDAPNPEALLAQSELKDRLANAIAALPEREKLVIALYYYENLTLREIGEVLGVTESRISQLHTKAVLRLKSRLPVENLRE